MIELNGYQGYLDKKAAGVFTELYFCDDKDGHPLANVLLLRPKFDGGVVQLGVSVSWVAPAGDHLKKDVREQFNTCCMFVLQGQ